ncbi:MAG: 8-amino-7-oxononanoate synthase, partial [Planctomycetales bacterium]|nr:8-amino-7-oxononanoate synthase [Planctomycetales bacterium]
VIDGRRVVNFGSNDYLGLAADSRLAAAVAAALPSAGWGAGSSPLIEGRAAEHAVLEARLAEFEGVEAALLFVSGFAANLGAVAALAGKGDVVFSDERNHASIIDGCRLSGARVQIYPHRDVDYLQSMLAQAGAFRRRLMVTDSLFSMDGSIAPLPALCDLAERHNAMLLVDEAHATGVFGPHGRGLCEHMGVEESVGLRVGTLSKALGSAGGFAAGSRAVIDWLANRARSYVFSTAPPAPWCAAGVAALELTAAEPQRRQTLLAQAARLRAQLSSQGWQTGAGESQIIPIYIGEPEPTMRLAERLLDAGLFVPGIRPPTVPAGESLLRVSLCAGHTQAMIDRLVDALGAAVG